MSFGAPAPDSEQPDHFEFTPENRALAERILTKYPPERRQSGMIPLLDLAQRQHGWLPRAAMDHVAEILGVPAIRAYEVATFYTMFNKAPVGKYLLQVCTTTPCWLCGSENLLRAIREKAGIAPGETSADGTFTVVEAECLGACVNAPMMQVNDDYYEDLDYERTLALLDALARGEPPAIGSQTGRPGSQAQAGPTSLVEHAPADIRAAAERRRQAAKPAPAGPAGSKG